MSDLGTCSGAGYGKCGRPNTEEDGWGAHSTTHIVQLLC